jgi:hypothetical protein
MSRLKELEAKLTLQQRKAALMLVENELMEGVAKKSQEVLAGEIGVDRITVYRWRTQNSVFIEYMNLLADDMLSAHRSEVYSQLLKLIRGSQPSVKAISLYMQRYGMLTQRQITETIDASSERSDVDLARELEEIDDLLNEK